MSNEVLQIGEAQLDCGTQALRVRGQSTHLSAKVYRVLRLLAAQPDETLARSVIIDAVWNGNHYVGQRGLTNVIWQLRRHLGPHAITTVAKAGYRLELAVNANGARRAGVFFRGLAVIFVVTVAAMVTAWAWPESEAEPGQPYTTAASLTYFNGVEEYPAYSRSGDVLAFSWEKAGLGARIMLRDLRDAAKPLRQVSLSADDEIAPAWSPDDTALAFARVAADGSCTVLIRTLENLHERIVDGCVYERYHRILEWSADGRFLFYTGKGSNGGAVAIMRRDLATGETRRMTRPGPAEEDNQLAAAPNGHRLAFVRTAGATASVHLLEEDGTISQAIAGEPVFGLAWQDDRHLVLNMLREGGFNLWQLNVITGALRPLHGAETPFNISVARDGSGRIAFSLHRGMEYLEVLDPRTGAVRNTVTSTGRDMYGSYSPARDLLTFLSTRSGRFEIWLSKPDGSQPRALTGSNGLPDVPQWSPGGQLLAASLLDRAGKSQVVLLEPGSAAIHWLTSGGANHRNLSWMDRNNLLLASDRDGEWNLWRLDLDNAGWLQLTTDGGQFGRLEGDYLYYTRYEEDGLWRRRLAGGVAERVLDDLQQDDWGSWDIGNGVLYYVKRAADFDEIRRMELKGGGHERVMQYPRNSVRIYRGLSLAPSGDLVITRLGNREADIIELVPVRDTPP